MSGVGNIGEIQVIEYLQKDLKMEVYLPLKDRGIDFVVINGDKAFQVQVKTSMFQKDSYFWFDLYKKKMRYSESIVYIFVCMTMSRRSFMGKKLNFIVIPSLVLQKWILEGMIASKKNDDDCLNMFLYPDFEKMKWTYKNKGKGLDWTPYWNNFSFFRSL
jgi:hypothetical protein